VQRAIDALYAYDYKLFELRADEWSIAHRFALYLEREIPGWNVDCEYNKQGENYDPKTNARSVRKTKRARPDIILHHRGQLSREHNLLVVELKVADTADDTKVKEFTRSPAGKRKFQYQFGLALSFLPNLNPRWYADGTRHP